MMSKSIKKELCELYEYILKNAGGDLPDECPITAEHALVHLREAALDVSHEDWGMTVHNIAITMAILVRMQNNALHNP